MKIIVYGNRDKNEITGFPTEEHFVDYICGEVFTKYKGRYQFSQQHKADRILLSREGKVYGYFEISGTEKPGPSDMAIAKNPRKVYLVEKSVIFEKPVSLIDQGITGFQFGKSVSAEQFEKIIESAGRLREVQKSNILATSG